MASSDVPGPGQFTFVRKEDRGGNDGGNMAAAFARKALRDEYSKADGQLLSDFESVLRGEAIYLPNFHCAKRDYALLAGLAKDMEEHESASEGGGMINWSKHLKHENPEFSETFKRVTDAMAAHFDVEIYATRLNFYRDGTDWKPFHHDSHAYGGREKREDFTMGASFGSERELTFLHEPSGQQFSFPQRNGDVFAFTTEVNKRFKHGVPKLTRGAGGPRFSIIAWGRRRTLNANNGGAKGGELRSAEDNLDHAATRDAATVSAVPATTREGASNPSWVPAKSPSSSARFCAMRRRAIRENARAHVPGPEDASDARGGVRAKPRRTAPTPTRISETPPPRRDERLRASSSRRRAGARPSRRNFARRWATRRTPRCAPRGVRFSAERWTRSSFTTRRRRRAANPEERRRRRWRRTCRTRTDARSCSPRARNARGRRVVVGWNGMGTEGFANAARMRDETYISIGGMRDETRVSTFDRREKISRVSPRAARHRSRDAEPSVGIGVRALGHARRIFRAT